ncbi:putative DNA-binding WGR domain protein [Rhizobium sp. SG_E_25_P2]|uniref:WGR domain-containing protein n=1 Tax=Rhizobium sp. SG_E_25_P2 TaxID=2879942 RepID=UPI002476E3AF|nr:WGR domain-containing protein [Rhizobium sp. SG_E_25_P2]MDH6265933.1 putative DNA-binding WGR domain protein [Rhizobium sp. SG_E_25_P2]
MIRDTIKLYGERRDPGRNMARFFALEITHDLLGGIRLERRWGRIGQHGRLAVDMYSNLKEAKSAMEVWRARKFSNMSNAYIPKEDKR